MNFNFETVSALQLRCQAQAQQIESFQSGEKYKKMEKEYKALLGLHHREIKQLEYNLSKAHREIVTVRKNWSEVMDDLDKEHKKELKDVYRIVKN